MPIIGLVIVVMFSLFIIRVSKNSVRSIVKLVIGIIVILGIIEFNSYCNKGIEDMNYEREQSFNSWLEFNSRVEHSNRSNLQ
jgi:uncharacterized membrane protein